MKTKGMNEKCSDKKGKGRVRISRVWVGLYSESMELSEQTYEKGSRRIGRTARNLNTSIVKDDDDADDDDDNNKLFIFIQNINVFPSFCS